MAEGDGVLEVDDAVILVLGAPSTSPRARNRLEGVTRLEKLLFLLQRETSVGELLTEDPGFVAYNFGPFSAKVYQAVDTLVSAGLIEDSAAFAESTEDAWETQEVIGARVSDPYATRNFALTERGRRYYEALVGDLPKDVESTLSSFKNRFAALPLRQLVRYVYERYPQYTVNSVIRDDILGR